MAPTHLFQFLLFSIGIYSFSIFTYLIFFYDFLSSNVLNEIQLHYDFIIVGSGTAGSIIAHRLAKETNYTFIVLEAGAKGHFFHDIPVFGPLLHNSIFDWQYESVPQENACLAMEGAKCKQTQGKILGGSSKLNNMIHVRGNIYHYVEWFHGLYTADYIKNQFEHVEKNFYHFNTLQYESQLSNTVLDAAKELGFSILNNDFGTGFRRSVLTQKQGKRWTASDNLDAEHVFTNVFVEKLVIHNDKKCLGVQINTPKKVIYANKGVIVSAGAFNSAKILQLSGIGPKDVLDSLNITIINDLPVGKNLQDHVGTGLDLVLFDEPQSVGMFDVINLFNVFKYFYHGNGPLTTPGCEVVGFISTSNGTSPDIQYMVLPVGISSDRGSYLKKTLGITDKVWTDYFAKIFDKYSATFMTLLLHPKSKGEVRIQSKVAHDPPLINPKYFNNKDDVRIIIGGLKTLKKILETNSMKFQSAQLNEINFPGCEEFEFFSDDYLECYIKHLTLTSFHPVGTCAMGLPESKESVVDTSFKVLGIDNLFVVDGSVLPTLPSGNINAAIAMMANLFFDNTISIKNIRTNKSCDNITLKEFILRVCQLK